MYGYVDILIKFKNMQNLPMVKGLQESKKIIGQVIGNRHRVLSVVTEMFYIFTYCFT